MKSHFLLVLAVACCAQVSALAGTAQILRGHVPAAVAKLTPVGRLPASTNLQLAIGLPLRNQEALTNFLRELYDPASTNYHRYLSPAQFTARFGPTEQDYQKVVDFARAHGLRVTATHPNRVLLDVSGTVANIEKAFHLTLRIYQHPTEARTFYAPDVEPSVDASIPILHVSGLDNFAPPRPLVKEHSLNTAAPASGSGPSGTYIGYDFRAAYAQNVALTGNGQSVGLLEFDGYYPRDIAAYKSLAGLPDVTVTNVLLDGFPGTPGSGNIEVALDIDMAIAMAPGLLEVIVYEGTNPDDMLNQMATDDSARQLSSSWTWSPFDATSSQIFQEFAAQGQTMFEASGDGGAYVGAVATPADNPYITVVGGTELVMTNNGGSRASESVWNWNNGYASGGGISTTYALPVWQQGIDMTANQGSTTMRNLPDVAMVADNVFIYAFDGSPESVAGTSCAAPLWAGLTALINQLAETNGEPAVGFINPAIYAISKGPEYAGNFNDITVGNNESSISPNLFPAVPGYDLCTGWGTPIGSNLVYTLGIPEPLRIAPLTGFVFVGIAGGAFMPVSRDYVLTNNGASPLEWSLSTTSAWLNATPTGGTLTPGGPVANVVVSLTPAVSNLTAGSYSAVIWFTNRGDHFLQSRPVTLAVVTQPVITTQPVSEAVFEGENVSFTVQTATNALLSFQWQFDNGSYLTNLTDGGNIAGSMTPTLTLSNVSPAEVGGYSVVVSNLAGVAASDDAFLTIVPWRPVITLQPGNSTVLPGATAIFNVAAVGTHPFSYQWQWNGTNLANFRNITGATTNSLIIRDATSANAGTYSVIVQNSLGSESSTGAVLSVISVSAPGVTFNSLYSFGDLSGGLYPFSPLARGPDGNFYGTTIESGTNYGSVFSVTTDGAISTLALFGAPGGGAVPYAGLVLGRDGAFYGATSQGGLDNSGVIFRITTNAILTNLAYFDGANGAFPVAGLAQGTDGNFYGTTLYGGDFGYGNVFSVTTGGVLSNLVSFNGTNGAFPSCVLIQARDGDFYGTTESGGINGSGTVFRMTPAGGLATLVSFGPSEGNTPISGLAQDSDGSFYSTTYYGGVSNNGTIFKMTPDGTVTTIYAFTGQEDGGNPWGGVLLGTDGNLYGTTQFGGAYSYGTVFRMGPNGSLGTLAAFDGYEGANPVAAPTQGVDGNLYGTASEGGDDGYGTIYQVVLSGPLQITSQPANLLAYVGATASFNVATSGELPVTYQWQRHGRNLSDGGNLSGSATRTLTITNVTPANASVYSVLVSNVTGKVYSQPAALEVAVSPPFITEQPADQTLLEGGTAVFSVTAFGDLPIAYQWQKNGTNLADGGNIQGSAASALTLSGVIAADSGSYSVILSNAIDWTASSDAELTVIPLVAPGCTYALVHSHTNGPDGANPDGLTLGRDGNLYVTTQYGGIGNNGTVLELTTAAGVRTTLASFHGYDGASPYAGVIQAGDGNFYGTCANGGVTFNGTIFRARPNGPFTNLYSFTGGDDGGNPLAMLLQGGNGAFYGTASEGGAAGYGTIFEATTNGFVTNLYAFSGGADGAYPSAELIQGADGNFYGTTTFGGATNLGTVFQMTPGGIITTLHSFIGGDGARPLAGLTRGLDGKLYGTTSGGGSNNLGTVFNLTTKGVLTTLYQFSGTDGANPQATLVWNEDGFFYGVTATGGLGGQGTLFRISANGALTNLVWFEGSNGANPVCPLVKASRFDFYGATFSGGADGNGAIFHFTIPAAPQITLQPSNQLAGVGANVALTVGATGTAPMDYQWQLDGTNLADGGNLFGSTTPNLTLTNVVLANGGVYSVIVSNAYGVAVSSNALVTIYPVAAPGIGLLELYSFTGENDGANPNGLIQAANGVFFGTTQAGGSNGVGTVFQMAPGGAVAGLYSFSGGMDGGSPQAALAQGADGSLYGTTFSGGTDGLGTIFRIATNGGLVTLADFNSTNGANPYAGLIQGMDGNFYGMTYSGGATGVGTAFSITNGAGPVTLAEFNYTNGADPYAGLAQGADGNFYGTTEMGGANGAGAVFRLAPSGLLTTLLSFEGTNGANPYAALVQGPDGNFYGGAYNGGLNQSGAVFKITTNGQLTLLNSFNGSDGANPRGALALGPDGNFYGTTETGGPGNAGTAFKITSGGALTTLAAFDGFNGANPQAALTRAADGCFYGTTKNGGANGKGTIFRLSVPLPPVLDSVTQNAGVLDILWGTVAGRSYQLQYTTDLAQSNWIVLGGILTATNGTMTTPDVIGPDPHRFYRLVLLQ